MLHTAEEIVDEIPALAGAGWSCCAHPPGAVTDPAELQDLDCGWLPVQIPGTAASALRDEGRWNFDQPVDLDASDWWFRKSFVVSADQLDRPCTLCFDGLATLAEVWLNGESILTADNMFRAWRVDVSSRLQTENELVLVCRSLSQDLQRKRPRPKWKTNLVSHQQLRWHRTSLLGRIPGWSPPVPTIGPWRDVRLETQPIQLLDRHLQTRLEGTIGIVEVEVRVSAALPIQNATLRVGDFQSPLSIHADADAAMLSGELRIADAPRWWPHTHGEPELLPCEITVTTGEGTLSFPCGELGFRQLEVDQTGGGFIVRVNGMPIFCRGACWTVSDVFTLTGTPESLERDLRLMREAGANMLRVGGTMTYESEEFYRLCDRLGILVWQDFMFASMDYPVRDEAFRQNITREAVEQLRRLSAHPSVAVYCGNSEVEQQAAMLGLPRETWRNDWFARELPALCAAHHAGTAYVPSTPCGGTLPFHPRIGLTHYYGVGAYLRPVDDVRRSDVRFTPECLGFSNLPEDATIKAITGGALSVPHSPQWKERVPRDTGAGWDFEDVRDHYVRELFGVDPIALRSRNLPRYLQLGRIATGEMMSQVFSEWRSTYSRTSGALVWFCKDLWPAAGWGILDSAGRPKAAYYALKRVWKPRQLTMTDEGLNGLQLHLTNEMTTICSGTVEVQLLREPNIVIAQESTPLRLEPRSRLCLGVEEILGRFCDASYAYRFGPPPHDIVAATWFDEQHEAVSEAFHFIHRRDPSSAVGAKVEASAREIGAGKYQVEMWSDIFLHSVRLQAPNFLPDDNYFHLVPQRKKTVVFRTHQPVDFQAEFEALNLPESRSIPYVIPGA